MNTIKDLMNDTELMRNIIEDLEDFKEDTPVTYEVWVMGYDENNMTTDMDMWLIEFEDPDKAIEFAKQVALADVIHWATNNPSTAEAIVNTTYISIEVETVIANSDNSTMNVGTIYKKQFMI